MSKEKNCFVIMPISEIEGYGEGHFSLVYKHLLKPACEEAGFKAIRADEVNGTNHIVIDILQKIIESDMVLCDLSANNPNVLYELGIRQAFNRPVSLIKDKVTQRIFDIQGLRQVEYDHSLRIDNVQKQITQIANTLSETYKANGAEVNSLIQLLGIPSAKLANAPDLSTDTQVILNALSDINQRMRSLEESSVFSSLYTAPNMGGKSNPGSTYFFRKINESKAENLAKALRNPLGES